MIIRYERTVEYEIDVSPEYILSYAKKLLGCGSMNLERVSLQDLIHDMAEDTLGIHPTSCWQDQYDYREPTDPWFVMVDEEYDPFKGGSCTIEELEENLKQFKEED
jgi:hypothetical protein